MVTGGITITIMKSSEERKVHLITKGLLICQLALSKHTLIMTLVLLKIRLGKFNMKSNLFLNNY